MKISFKKNPFFTSSRSWRVRTPLLLQMEAVECGAAALGIILGYYRKFVPLGELRQRCAVSRDGINLLNLIKAAEFYGLQGKGMRITFSHLENHKKPVILLWKDAHFVVLEGIKKGKVYINDPEHGSVVYKKDEFLNSFSGVAVFIEPTKDFIPSPFKVNAWQRFKKECKAHPFTHLFLILSSLLLFILTLAIPITFRVFIDHIYDSNVIGWKIECLGFLAIALGLGLLISAFSHVLLKKVSAALSEQTVAKHFFHLLKFPLSFFGQRNARELVQRIDTISQLNRSYYEEVIPTFIELILSFFYAALIFSYSPLVGSITFIGVFLSVLAMHTISRSRLALYDTWERDKEHSEEASTEQLHCMDAIKAVGSEHSFFYKWIKSYTHMLNTNQTIGKKQCLLTLFPFFIQFFSTALLIGVGTQQVLSGKLSLGSLAALQIFLILFLVPLKKLIDLAETINQIRRNVCRVNDLTHTSLDPFFVHHGKKKVSISTLTFQDVNYSFYPHSLPILKNISFAIKPQECLGISGPGGSGKSTLGKLAAALYHPTQGNILYEGNKIEELDPESFRQSVAWVGEEGLFFPGSLYHNLTFWSPSSISDEILHQVEEKIEHSLDLNRFILEEGKNLSTSEKQLLELARVFLKKPSLLILDHGLYALPQSYQEKVLKELRKTGCTLLCITYDDFILDQCDRVLHLSQGELA